MPRKAVRVELSKLSVTLIKRALEVYVSHYGSSSSNLEFTVAEEQEIERLIDRFSEHLKSFEDNLTSR